MSKFWAVRVYGTLKRQRQAVSVADQICETCNAFSHIWRFAELGVIEDLFHIIIMRGPFAKITSIT